MGEHLGFACTCGKLRGEITDVTPAAYTNIVCHCADCRSAYTHFGLADPEKVGILQTTQDRVKITQGGEHLRVFRLSGKGALRWYAKCCDTPLFFTPTKARAVHVGINTDRLDQPERVGKPVVEGFKPVPGGGHKHIGAGRMVARMATRIAAKNLNGEWRNSPFFDDEGAPTATPKVLTREQRAAALQGIRV
ncbi:DUF6151 family protein [Jannaschia sp. 2305UL9-9]|uniref:DUF6151 family protein n=1 Tax=Jannaschia sp. 2305UL9-9 TaxID=3121638 RepID=UPI0035293FD3